MNIFSATESSTNYVILSNKIDWILLEQNILYEHSSKLLITNITVVIWIDNKCSIYVQKYVQTFRKRFLIYVNKLHMTGTYMVWGNFSKQA